MYESRSAYWAHLSDLDWPDIDYTQVDMQIATLCSDDTNSVFYLWTSDHIFWTSSRALFNVFLEFRTEAQLLFTILEVFNKWEQPKILFKLTVIKIRNYGNPRDEKFAGNEEVMLTCEMNRNGEISLWQWPSDFFNRSQLAVTLSLRSIDRPNLIETIVSLSSSSLPLSLSALVKQTTVADAVIDDFCRRWKSCITHISQGDGNLHEKEWSLPVPYRYRL